MYKFSCICKNCYYSFSKKRKIKIPENNIYGKEGTLSNLDELIIDFHNQGYHCSETLIRALWPQLLPQCELSETILKMTSTLHGGMAETMSSHCGGLTVGILLIGALYGRSDAKGDARYDCAIARGYWQLFLDEFKTSHCTTLKKETYTGGAQSRCTYIMIRSAHLFLQFISNLKNNPIDKEELYHWRVDRTIEPCHEQIIPLKPAEEIKAELIKNEIQKRI